MQEEAFVPVEDAGWHIVFSVSIPVACFRIVLSALLTLTVCNAVERIE